MSEISNPHDCDKSPDTHLMPCEYRRGSEAGAADLPGSFTQFADGLISAVNSIAISMCLRPYTPSPIEIALGTRLIADLNLKLDTQPQPDCWTLVPQWWTRNFRFDFALVRGAQVILIECDSREYHSTPEQKARDRRKDAEAATYGWLVLRFTGSQIHHDVAQCVEIIRDAIGDL